MLVRPSFVLGGRGMEIVYDTPSLEDYFDRMREQAIIGPGSPLLVDRFLDDAIEIDVDALYDGTELYVGGIMEHIEEAGIHSGDSACTLPPVTLGRDVQDQVVEATLAIAEGVGVRGLLNVQFAIGAGVLYVLEANPRASRTVPFVSKALGIPLAKAASLRHGRPQHPVARRRRGCCPSADGSHVPLDSPVSVKEAVLPFKRFRTSEGNVVDSVLGPEMRSTGEVMGIDRDFPRAFAKSQDAAYGGLPTSGTVFVSVADRDKRAIVLPILRLSQLGFDIVATEGTAEVLARNGIAVAERAQVLHGPGGRAGRAVDRRADQRGRDRRRDQHAVRSQRARRRLRDPRRDGRGRQAAVHHDRAARCRGRARSRCARGEMHVRSCRTTRSTAPAGWRHGGGAEARFARSASQQVIAAARPALRRHRPARVAAARVGPARRPPSGAREFGLRVVDAAAGRVGVVKPQVAFFERYGSAGYARARGRARGRARAPACRHRRRQARRHRHHGRGLRRGWLTPGSPLEADALTVAAYQGLGSLDAVIALAPSATARGCSCSPRPRTRRRAHDADARCAPTAAPSPRGSSPTSWRPRLAPASASSSARPSTSPTTASRSATWSACRSSRPASARRAPSSPTCADLFGPAAAEYHRERVSERSRRRTRWTGRGDPSGRARRWRA